MIGTWVLEESYWKAIANALPVLRAFDEAVANEERAFPVHLAYGTHGAYAEAFIPNSLPMLAGLPVNAVRADQSDSSGELLLFFGDYRLGAEWQAKLSQYKQVILDQVAIERNKDILEQLQSESSNLTLWHQDASNPENLGELQELITSQKAWEFPQFVEGNHIGLLWLKESGKCILFNLLETENEGLLKLGGNQYPVHLPALSFAVIDSSGTVTQYNTEIDL